LIIFITCVVCSYALSRLRISLAKSELVPIGKVNNVEGLASTLGCRVSSLPMKYLGLPLRALFKAKFIFALLLLIYSCICLFCYLSSITHVTCTMV
jgi:hypothetical protein